MPLFDFTLLLEELRNHENREKKAIIEKYETLLGPITGDVQDQKWYIEYCSKFSFIDYKLPFASKDDFDFGLLCQLAAASLSSDVQIIYKDNIHELNIAVENNGIWIAKNVSELFGYQIDRLFKIYCEEQMTLSNHILENEREKVEIFQQKEYKLRKWHNLLLNASANKIIQDTHNDLNDSIFS